MSVLGNTEVRVSNLGIGCAPFGGAMGKIVSDEEVNRVVTAAVNRGINYFDTAPHYGNGYSEKRLLKSLTHQSRVSVTISTKVGVSLIPGLSGHERRKSGQPFSHIDFESPEPFESRMNFSKDAVAESIEQSISRLGCAPEVIYIHDPDEAVTLINRNADPYSRSHFEEVMEHVYPYLHMLRQSGRIKAIGIGINQWQMLRDFAKSTALFDVFLLARQFTLIDHSDAWRELIPLCEQKNISLVIAGVYHNGILHSGSQPANGAKPFMDVGEASEAIIKRVSAIETICKKHCVSLKSAALQFPFRSKMTACVLTGVASENELTENIFWFEKIIPEDFWYELQKSALIEAP